MELVKVVVPLLMLLAAVGFAFCLPWWLGRYAWFRCLENWVWYRRWHPCPHPVNMFRRYGPPLPATKEAEVWEFACQDCGTVFLRETWATWTGETPRMLHDGRSS